MLDRAVLVHVTRDSERGQLADFLSGSDRPTENQDRHAPVIHLADRAHEVHTAGVRQPQIEHDEVKAIEVGPDSRQQLRRALHAVGRMTRAEQRRGEPIAHERGIVSDDDGFCRGHFSTRLGPHQRCRSRTRARARRSQRACAAPPSAVARALALATAQGCSQRACAPPKRCRSRTRARDGSRLFSTRVCPQALSLAHSRSRRLKAVLSALNRLRIRFGGRLDSVAQSTHNRIGGNDLRR